MVDGGRRHTVYQGRFLQLKSLGKTELLMTKCWAYCDRERDIEDIIAMQPSERDLENVTRWLKPLDGNPDWSTYVEERMREVLNRIIRE